MHEVGRAVGHESDDVVTNNLTVHSLGNLFLEGAEVVGFLSVELFTGSNSVFVELVGHRLFEFKQHLEQILTEVGQVLLFKELGVNLGKTVEFRVHLVLGDGALVSNQVLEL